MKLYKPVEAGEIFKTGMTHKPADLADIREALKELGMVAFPLEALNKLSKLNATLRTRIPFDDRYPELTEISRDVNEIFREARKYTKEDV